MLKSILAMTLLQSVIILCIIDRRFQHLAKFRNHVFRIHPLILVVENGEKSLLGYDKLNEYGIPTFIKNTEQLVLFCSGYNNFIAMNKKAQSLNIDIDEYPKTYDRMHGFLFGKFPQWQYNLARCISPMLASVDKKKEKCANDKGTLIRIIFYLVEKTLRHYEICFDKISETAIYTSHQLIGSDLLFPEIIGSTDIPMSCTSKSNFSTDAPGIPYNIPGVQKKIFRRSFKDFKTRWYFNFMNKQNGKLFTAVKLTPPGDFYYPPLKTATYFYENTLPVFDCIYQNQLRVIEVLGRILALQVKPNALEVITGSFEILTLPDGDGIEKIVHLDQEKNGKPSRPIPKYLYKIYYDRKSKKGIVFVTLNNPFYKFPITDFPCKHIGTKFIHMDYLYTGSVDSRITIYCDIQELKEKVKDIPDDIDASKGILYLNIYNKNLPMGQLQSCAMI